MGRTVVTHTDLQREIAVRRNQGVADTTASTGQSPDRYSDRLLKYIPTEIVAIYLALLGLLNTAANPQTTSVAIVQWTLFWIMLVVTIPWQRRILRVTKWQQVAIGTLAFVFWAISLGEPFDSSWKTWGYQPLFGTMAMMLYTFLIPLFEAQ